MGGEAGHEISLEFTPTWVTAGVFAVFAIISFILENTFLSFRKLFDKSMNNNQVVGRGNNNNNLVVGGGNNNNNQGGGGIELGRGNNNNNQGGGGIELRGGNNNNNQGGGGIELRGGNNNNNQVVGGRDRVRSVLVACPKVFKISRKKLKLRHGLPRNLTLAPPLVGGGNNNNNNQVIGGGNNNNNQGGDGIELVGGNNNNNQVVGGGNNNNQGRNNNNQPLSFSVTTRNAHRKIIEELAVVGFMFPILLFSEDSITKICIPRSIFDYMLPCSLADRLKAERQADAQPTPTFCSRKDMVPLLSLKALHEIELFIFILALLHIILSVITDNLGKLRMNRLEIYSEGQNVGDYERAMQGNWQDFQGQGNGVLFRLKVFCRSIVRPVTQSDYMILKYGFCTRQENLLQLTDRNYFSSEMIRGNKDYFKQIVHISFHLWVFAVICLVLNVQGWHGYFWIAIIPIIPLILMGAILENIVTQLATEISEAYERRDVPEAKDNWLNNCPDYILNGIQFIIFQTAFQMATFVWTWTRYGFGSCMMGQLYYTLPRLFFGVCTLGLCGYSTLPLYTIVTQLGNESSWATLLEIIIEHVHA